MFACFGATRSSLEDAFLMIQEGETCPAGLFQVGRWLHTGLCHEPSSLQHPRSPNLPCANNIISTQTVFYCSVKESAQSSLSLWRNVLSVCWADAEEESDCCSIMSVLTLSQGHDWVEFKHLQTLKYQLLDGFLLFQITHSGFFAVCDYEKDVVPISAKSLLQHSIASGHQSVSAATSTTLSLCYFWSQHPTHCIWPRRETKLSFVCSRSV